MLRNLIIIAFVLSSFNHCQAQTKPVSSSSHKEGKNVSQAQLSSPDPDAYFKIEPLSDEVMGRMLGKSYPKDCPIPRSELRYLTVLHVGAQGETLHGELVCNKLIAGKLLRIFRKLYEAGYKIERMQLIDDYDANDEKSMTANNTSCFCFRQVTGSKTISLHGRGLAIDINPLYNPCVRTVGGKQRVEPAAGKPYISNRAGRSDIPLKIDANDLAYRLFIAEGFQWGGNWKSLKDYQHFEYPVK